MKIAQALIFFTVLLLIGVSDAQESSTKKSRSSGPKKARSGYDA